MSPSAAWGRPPAPGGRPAKGPWRPLALLWAGAGTLVGLALALLARVGGGRVRGRDGVLEAHGGLLVPLLRRLGGRARVVEALTLGHVVLAPDAARLAEHRAHERVHVRQWERWGPLFPFAYLALALWARAHGRDGYRANRFEREAWGDPPGGDPAPPRA